MGVSPPNFSGAGVLDLGVRPQREPLRTWSKALSQGAASKQGDSHSPARCVVKLHTLTSLFISLRPVPCEGWLGVQETSGQCFTIDNTSSLNIETSPFFTLQRYPPYLIFSFATKIQQIGQERLQCVDTLAMLATITHRAMAELAPCGHQAELPREKSKNSQPRRVLRFVLHCTVLVNPFGFFLPLHLVVS